MKYLLILLVLFFIFPKLIVKADEPLVIVPIMDYRVVALGKLFESYQCPLLPYVDDFIAAADKYNIDYRLLPAISIKESTCGKHYPINTNNPFGWHPIRTAKGEISVLKFESLPIAIDFITGQLANNSPYVNKTIYQKLKTYCPTEGYPEGTIMYMNKIENKSLTK